MGIVEEQAGLRFVEDVEMLRALAEPTRLAILYALIKPPWPRVMSVKELAAELDEPPTKLYRHVRKLEEADLIKVAETRMVSGILEHRYQSSTRDLRFAKEFVRSHPDDSLAALHTVIDRFGRGLIAPDDDYLNMMFASEIRLAPEQAHELARKLKDVQQLLDQVTEDPDGVPVNVVLGFYVG